MKTKVLISFAVTAKLICVFVFVYVKSRFSHDAAHITSLLISSTSKSSILISSIHVFLSQFYRFPFCLLQHHPLCQFFDYHFFSSYITVYHRLQYLLPGESVKMADMTRSGVSQTFFQRLLMSVFLRNEKNLCLNVFICCPCA